MPTRHGQDPGGTANLVTRRQALRAASAVGLAGLLPASVAQAQPVMASVTRSTPAAHLYKALGVRPLINCRGTLTVIGGSMELPEVREAKSLANQQYVQLDELMLAAGRRLGELTGAEWGMVSSGCAAAMSHATAACVAGGNPDLHVRLPDLRGFAKTEVVIPGHSRNVYDAAIRAVGVTIVEADTPDALRLAIGPKTAMIYVFANERNEAGPMSLEQIAAIASPFGVPIMVDAAAEILTVPNVHLQRGATLVGYSGGKILRGPQSAGLLLGRKDLVQAAWMHSAPHHGYARGMKVGREEIVGMVVAVERWVARDHEAEWAEWVARCDRIAAQVGAIPGVQAIVRRDVGTSRSNRSPRVTIRWTTAERGIDGAAVAALLDAGEPRILLGGGGGGGGGGGRTGPTDLPGDTGLTLTTSMLADGDDVVVAARVSEVLSVRRTLPPAPTRQAPAGDLTGQWFVEIAYIASTSTHRLQVHQRGHVVEGTHRGEFVSRDVLGTIDGDAVSLTSRVTERTGDSLNYRFTGRLHGDAMSGDVDMGEYGKATWSAKRAGAADRSGSSQP